MGPFDTPLSNRNLLDINPVKFQIPEFKLNIRLTLQTVILPVICMLIPAELTATEGKHNQLIKKIL